MMMTQKKKKRFRLQTVIEGSVCCSGNTAFSTINCLLGFLFNKIELREILFFNVGRLDMQKKKKKKKKGIELVVSCLSDVHVCVCM